jgi:hypothetical protein
MACAMGRRPLRRAKIGTLSFMAAVVVTLVLGGSMPATAAPSLDADLAAVVSAGIGAPLYSAHTGKCIDLAGSDPRSGAAIVQWDCHYGPNQNWYFLEKDGYRRMHSEATGDGKCVDVEGKSGANGARIHQWECQGDSEGSQEWWVKYMGEDPWFIHVEIVNRRSDKCMDLPGGDPTSGVQLTQWDCHGGSNQIWLIYKFA